MSYDIILHEESKSTTPDSPDSPDSSIHLMKLKKLQNGVLLFYNVRKDQIKGKWKLFQFEWCENIDKFISKNDEIYDFY